VRVKVARRYQITIPEQVRDEAGISIGDTLDVRSQDGKVIIEKLGKDWQAVMDETRGSWRAHPAFKGMKDSGEVVNWLRQKQKVSNNNRQSTRAR
jgi:AbrB family looped-hinge helix DNA binding protein